MKNEKDKILSKMFQNDSDKIAPPPSWYSNLVLFVFALIIMGIYYLFSKLQTGILFLAMAFILIIAMFVYRRKVLIKIINEMPKEKLGKYKSKTKFSKCKLCDKEPSKTGNYTNMFLSKIHDPQKFDEKYGMMCSNHATEITKKILKEKNLDEKDWERAAQKALQVMDQELKELTKK